MHSLPNKVLVPTSHGMLTLGETLDTLVLDLNDIVRCGMINPLTKT